MSAFLVNAATMDSAVNAIIDHCDEFAGISLGPVRDDPAQRAAAGGVIGRKLFALNCRALRERYGRAERAPRYATLGNAPLDILGCYKCLCCLLYQCSEGRVPETRLYRALEAAGGVIAMRLISETAAFDAAPWGL